MVRRTRSTPLGCVCFAGHKRLFTAKGCPESFTVESGKYVIYAYWEALIGLTVSPLHVTTTCLRQGWQYEQVESTGSPFRYACCRNDVTWLTTVDHRLTCLAHTDSMPFEVCTYKCPTATLMAPEFATAPGVQRVLCITLHKRCKLPCKIVDKEDSFAGAFARAPYH